MFGLRPDGYLMLLCCGLLAAAAPHSPAKVSMRSQPSLEPDDHGHADIDAFVREIDAHQRKHSHNFSSVRRRGLETDVSLNNTARVPAGMASFNKRSVVTPRATGKGAPVLVPLVANPEAAFVDGEYLGKASVDLQMGTPFMTRL